MLIKSNYENKINEADFYLKDIFQDLSKSLAK